MPSLLSWSSGLEQALLTLSLVVPFHLFQNGGSRRPHPILSNNTNLLFLSNAIRD
jgi:hypothetical protein